MFSFFFEGLVFFFFFFLRGVGWGGGGGVVGEGGISGQNFGFHGIRKSFRHIMGKCCAGNSVLIFYRIFIELAKHNEGEHKILN